MRRDASTPSDFPVRLLDETFLARPTSGKVGYEEQANARPQYGPKVAARKREQKKPQLSEPHILQKPICDLAVLIELRSHAIELSDHNAHSRILTKELTLAVYKTPVESVPNL